VKIFSIRAASLRRAAVQRSLRLLPWGTNLHLPVSPPAAADWCRRPSGSRRWSATPCRCQITPHWSGLSSRLSHRAQRPKVAPHTLRPRRRDPSHQRLPDPRRPVLPADHAMLAPVAHLIHRGVHLLSRGCRAVTDQGSEASGPRTSPARCRRRTTVASERPLHRGAGQGGGGGGEERRLRLQQQHNSLAATHNQATPCARRHVQGKPTHIQPNGGNHTQCMCSSRFAEADTSLGAPGFAKGHAGPFLRQTKGPQAAAVAAL